MKQDLNRQSGENQHLEKMVKEAEDAAAAWLEMKKRVTDNSEQLPEDAHPDAKRAERQSQSRALLLSLLSRAEAVAKDENLAPMSAAAWKIFEEASGIASDLTFASLIVRLPYPMKERAKLTEAEAREIFRITHPKEANDLIEDAKKKKRMRVDQSGLEDGIGRYLQSPFQSSDTDRLLITAIIDLEVTGYLHHLFSTDDILDILGSPRARWLQRAMPYFILLTSILAGLYGAERLGWLSSSASFFLLTATAIIFGISLVLFFLVYVIVGDGTKTIDEKTAELLKEMISFYSELHSTGPLSVRWIRDRATEITAKGAVWPSAFWAILSETEHRGVRTLR